jgi:hypothetical protein
VEQNKGAAWPWPLIALSLTLILLPLAGACDSTDGGPVLSVSGGISFDNTVPDAGAPDVVDVSKGLRINSGTPVDPSITTWEGWEDAILRGIGAPTSSTNRGTLWAWQRAEKPAGQPLQWNNPLNTTQPAQGSWGAHATGTPGVSVQGYPTLAIGAGATVATLAHPYYPDIVAALRSSTPTPYWGSAARSELNTWGTGSRWL